MYHSYTKQAIKMTSISPKKKQKPPVLMNIITEGRNLFIEVGAKGFNMRALASKLGMTQGNLYHYVKSKRELWLLIRQFDHNLLKRIFEEIIHHPSESSISKILALLEALLDFAEVNPERFAMMYHIPLPPSDVVGPIEQKYPQPMLMQIIQTEVRKGIAQGEIRNQNVRHISVYLYSLYFGASSLQKNIERDFSGFAGLSWIEDVIPTDLILRKDEIDEMEYCSREEFKKYLLEETRRFLQT